MTAPLLSFASSFRGAPWERGGHLVLSVTALLQAVIVPLCACLSHPCCVTLS